MKVERIGIEWPREPDVEGFRPEYAETVRLRRLPFAMEDPFVFHVLTTLPTEQDLLQVMRDGGSLMPVSWADERWGDMKSMIFARDRVAGDDEYLFMTPCNVFAGYHDRARNHPAVAFRLSYVERVAKEIAFRVHDLEFMYQEAERLAADPEMFDVDLEDSEDAEAWDEVQAMLWSEEQTASAVEEQLQAIAEVGTQYETEASIELVQLYAQLVGGFRQEPMWVPENDPERVRIYQEASALFPEALLDADDWAADLLIERQVAQLQEDWARLFGVPGLPLPSFPARLLTAPGHERPELLVQGSLSLCEAAFYRDQEGAWRPVPEEVCLAGRSAA